MAEDTTGADRAKADEPPAKRKVKVAGQEIEIDKDKEDEFIAKGVRFSFNQNQLVEDRKKFETEKSQQLKELEPILEASRRVQGDPVSAAILDAILTGKPVADLVQANSQAINDPTLHELRTLRGEVEGLKRSLKTDISTFGDQVKAVTRDSEMQREERTIRATTDWAKDDDIQEAKDYAKQYGLTLSAAFRITGWDKAQEEARKKTIAEFGIDTDNIPSSAAPMVDGINPSDEATMNGLYDNIEEYAKRRDGLRTWRRNRRGVGAVPGSR